LCDFAEFLVGWASCPLESGQAGCLPHKNLIFSNQVAHRVTIQRHEFVYLQRLSHKRHESLSGIETFSRPCWSSFALCHKRHESLSGIEITSRNRKGRVYHKQNPSESNAKAIVGAKHLRE
jgi:hypothetical protein